MTLRSLFAAALLLAVSLAWGQDRASPHHISRDTDRLVLSTGAGMLLDPSGDLTAAQVAALVGNGAMVYMDRPATPIARPSAAITAWLKLEVVADASAPRDWILSVGRTNFDRVQLFTRAADGSWTGSAAAGSSLPFSARQVASRRLAFSVHIAAGSTTTILVRIDQRGAERMTATLWRPDSLQAHDRVADGFFFLFFGLMGGMLVYNLLLFVVVRDTGYLLYVGRAACLAVAVGAHTGLASQYVWGEWTWWAQRATLMGYGGAAFFSILFTRRLLSTRKRVPRLDRVLLVISCVAVCVAVAGATRTTHIGTALMVLCVVAMTVVFLGLSFMGMKRRWPGAVYFFAAALASHAGAVVAVLSNRGLTRWDIGVPEIIAFGTALEMTLFSLALADRIIKERKHNERAQTQSLTLMLAAQSLNREKNLDSLNARVRQIVCEVTGADTVHFVLCRAVIPEDAIDLGLPRTVLDHVIQTRQAVVIDDAMGDPRFRDDAALKGLACCSALGLPVVHQGSLVAVLLLEARERRGAFTSLALLAMEVVAGPLAVLLENVQLYEQLEQRVAEQTRELHDAQQDLEATARRAGQAEMAINVLHNVGNLLNSVNTSAQLVNSKVLRSRSHGLARAVELMESQAGRLGDFLERDPRGKVLPDYLNKLVAELARERHELMGELDRLVGSVNHIKAVVALQQA